MAQFTGTMKEFDKFVGPRLRNVVQTSISKRYKMKIGKCEDCKTKKNLESAHVHEKNRKKLILDALGEHFKDNMIDNLDLNDFEKRFVELHYPLNSTFKILCKSCHKKYDNVTGSFEVINIEVEDNKDFILESNLIIKETLEIEFNPSDILEFKELLLTNKSANITTLYNNNTSEVKEWNASNMTEKSDIIRNLRSRKEFRQGEWQKLGIEKVEVSINYN